MAANSPPSEAFHTLLLRAIPATTPSSPDTRNANIQTKTFICFTTWTRQTATMPDEVMYAQFGHDKLWLQKSTAHSILFLFKSVGLANYPISLNRVFSVKYLTCYCNGDRRRAWVRSITVEVTDWGAARSAFWWSGWIGGGVGSGVAVRVCGSRCGGVVVWVVWWYCVHDKSIMADFNRKR